MKSEYTEFAVSKTVELLAIDSPTGYTDIIADKIREMFSDMGFESRITKKGGIAVTLFDKAEDGNGILLEAHTDTLGGMVHEVKSNGRLRITKLGGLNPNNCEAENCRIITHFGKTYEGTLQLCNPSLHVNNKYGEEKRDFDTTEVVLDEDVSSAAEVNNLGIFPGDIVAFEPRTRITESGYIKSRFLDDKLSVGIIFGLAEMIRKNEFTPKRNIFVHITVYEEVGHGASAVPFDSALLSEVLSVDMGCVGEGISCTEKQVSICAKDSGGPYSYQVVDSLIKAAKEAGADYCVDIYPFYGSDAEATLRGGYDLRHGLIGSGVYASHGYERSHKDGVANSLKLLEKYLAK